MSDSLKYLYAGLLILLGSCVSYLPPSTLHHDMVMNRHPVIEDSTVSKAMIIYGDAHVLGSGFHHRRDPEMEDNRAWGARLGIGRADSTHSYGFSTGFSSGHMYDDEGLRYGHRNLILRGSYGYDFHDGRWHGNIIKFQAAGSRGFGRYQQFLRDNYENRDRYNLATADDRWLFSLGFGSRFYYDLDSTHDLGLGLYFVHSSDLEKDGFHAEYFQMDLDYVLMDRFTMTLGGMLDARFTPRGETLYLSLGYNHSF